MFFDVIQCIFVPRFVGECCTHVPSGASGSGGSGCFQYIDNPFLIGKGNRNIVSKYELYIDIYENCYVVIL